ncbi:CinA family protein [Herbiconiux sp. SYSU D00978]|uniref:CinA family protein n=1 Tax=Herbiconiux sp. SYSU D00978 TaxID=2812562 RepID=UPI001A95E515|nr:nicotinamide-nucleotide amidohydrolase family protein [Herbiconiux sp. SYSU D00978]
MTVPPRPDVAMPVVVDLVAELARRGLRVAVAESLTGGLVVSELIRPPGASAVVTGGVVAYDTGIKRSLLGVDADLLEREGPVHPEVARQMAEGVRRHLVIDGRLPDIGLATTGVAGPDPQGGKRAGTVFIAVATDEGSEARELSLSGTRDEVRASTVSHVLRMMAERVALPVDAP